MVGKIISRVQQCYRDMESGRKGKRGGSASDEQLAMSVSGRYTHDIILEALKLHRLMNGYGGKTPEEDGWKIIRDVRQ